MGYKVGLEFVLGFVGKQSLDKAKGVGKQTSLHKTMHSASVVFCEVTTALSPGHSPITPPSLFSSLSTLSDALSLYFNDFYDNYLSVSQTTSQTPFPHPMAQALFDEHPLEEYLRGLSKFQG